MFRTHELCFQGSVASFEVEDYSIEIGTNWMIAIGAPFPTTLELHSCLFEANATMISINLIFDYALKDGTMTNSHLKMNLEVS